jgi:hypothetical protein
VNYREEALQRTEKEIVAEKAATLGRASAWRPPCAWPPSCTTHCGKHPRVKRGSARASYRHARTRALEARRILIIQREAIGLRNHRLVDQQFPEPPRLDG